MQRRRISHVVAILVTLIVIVGLPWLPAIFGLGLPSWFSFAWLVLAILVLLAHLRRAQLFTRSQSKSQIKQQKRSRSNLER
jgi:fatty acid desaturase